MNKINRLGSYRPELNIVGRIAPRRRLWLPLIAVFAAFALVSCTARQPLSRDSDEPAFGVGRFKPDAGIDAMSGSVRSDAIEDTDYDPWEGFNEKTFWLNYDVLDRFVVKPAAQAWKTVVPEPVIEGLGNAFDNLHVVQRSVNSLLQGRLQGAGSDLVRFALNSTIGVAGLFDVASRLGIPPSDADTGQTLGVYGVGPGPYLVLPLLPPLTVRDAIGYGVDSLMDPLSYFAPLAANVGLTASKTINDRADKMAFYDGVEESALDLYAAVRNGYLQRRRLAIRNALRSREREWEGRDYRLHPVLRDPK